jgi:pimeloyl-ACP methyl ester carboxylesterase
MRTLVIIPGWNEPTADLVTLVGGRGGLPGLCNYDFECVVLPPCYERIRERIDRLAEFIAERRRNGASSPVTLLGYSLGGLVARGYLRAYPQRAHEIESVIALATPNFGVTMHILPTLASLLRISDKALPDLELTSNFMAWLNGTGGHWEWDPRIRKHLWVLDREPWLGPDGARIYGIAGLMTSRNGDGDGVVNGDSASLGSRIPTHYIIGPHCNHLNLIGHFDPIVFAWTGFLANDLVWPHTLRAIVRFTGARVPATAKISA